MTTHDQIRVICAQLPGATEGSDRFGFGVLEKGKAKGFCWSWAERVHPKKARVINDSVLAIRVPDLSTKDILLASDTEKFFTEPHYDGYAAVLVRLSEIEPDQLEDLLILAWRCTADKSLVAEFDREE